jgi:VIT1/CCC1 family predicted Fe2+/Mn2+ transporter/rubrerythrin
MDTRQGLGNLQLERDAIWLYDRLAEVESDPDRAAAFRHIAQNERRHEAVWARVLGEQGVALPPPRGPRIRVRFIVALARLFGTGAVAELVRALEGDEEATYAGLATPETEAMAEEEREHAEIWRRLQGEAEASERRARIEPDATEAGVQVADRAETPADIVRTEPWHRASRSGTFRAVIFGVSDGLVSNLALVMGVAGASQDPSVILLAGIAGLLAGAFSMAAGEYVSMQSQRELFERQINLERAEIEAMPEEEEAELAAIYRAKGFADREARIIAARIFQDRDMALRTLVREELGLDPDELGSPWGAALGSFVAFALGAVVPVLPYLFGSGPSAFPLSLGLSLVALFAVGAGVSMLTGRGTIFSGLRQALIGLGAATVTYLVGSLIGVAAGG